MTKSIARAVGLFAVVAVAGVAPAQTTQPVEWKVSEGGNGHWYQLVDFGMLPTWDLAAQFATSRGGYLGTVTSPTEQTAMVQVVQSQTATVSCESFGVIWLGGKQSAAGLPANQGWQWVTGEPWSYENWAPGEPNDYGNRPEDFLVFFGANGLWIDIPGAPVSSPPCVYGAMVEWSADCNFDGIVDYGQILSGQLDDDNTNGIPDICETSVTGVIPPSVPAQGGATVTIKGANFPQNPTVLIGGTPATNVVRISPTRLTATSPALMPGMTSISVNGFTLPDALYIRPECGSDLDQNGEVDAADISIILLDFGPCYPAPVTAPTTGPLPPAPLDAPTPASDAPQTR